MTAFLSGVWSEVATDKDGRFILSGSWVELAQVRQDLGRISGHWVEVAQVQEKEAYISGLWVEMVYLVGVPPEPEVNLPPEEYPRRRSLIMGISLAPELVEDPLPPPSFPGAIVLSGEAISTSTIQLVYDNAVGAVSHQYRLNGSTLGVMVSNKQITDLAHNTTYLVEVRGVNSSGPGPWSNQVSIKTWLPAVLDPNDVDGDGIPNINDPDHPDYDPLHPNSDPDGDGIPNVTDTDDDGDGILDVNEPTHADYDPLHPGSDQDGDGIPNNVDDDDDGDGILDVDDPDHPDYTDPVVATYNIASMSGWGGGYLSKPKEIFTNTLLTYGATGGTGPYSYVWALAEPGHLTYQNGALEVSEITPDPLDAPNGGTTRFRAVIPFGATLETTMKCTITDSLGASTFFYVFIRLTNADLTDPEGPT